MFRLDMETYAAGDEALQWCWPDCNMDSKYLTDLDTILTWVASKHPGVQVRAQLGWLLDGCAVLACWVCCAVHARVPPSLGRGLHCGTMLGKTSGKPRCGWEAATMC